VVFDNLYSIDPVPLVRQANSISTELLRSFDQWQHNYKKTVAAAASIRRIEKLHFPTIPHSYAWPSGNTRNADYPLLIYEDGIKAFNTRICIAICTGKTNTKVWCRASSPVGIDGITAPTKLSYIRKLRQLYEGITYNSLEWMSPKLIEMLNKHLDKPTVNPGRFIKVSILGVNDDSLAKTFADLCSQETTAANILKDKDIDERLTYYYSIIGDFRLMLSDYANGKNPSTEPCMFFKIPIWVTLATGYIEPRTVLFLLREREEFTEITGLAYDDSLEMDIPLRAGAKLSKIVGSWI
jgi:hypothetical protein